MSNPFGDLIPTNRPGGLAPRGGFVYSPPVDSVGQQQKAAELQGTELHNRQTAATAGDEARKAKADADLAELNEQEKKQQLLLQNGVPAPGDTTKTGPAYLATLPTSIRTQATAMLEGRTPYPTGAALKSPQVMSIVAAAEQADPTYNYANAITRLKTRQDFTSGMSSRNLTAINTALGHLGQLMTDAQNLKNTGSPMINAPVNAVRNNVLGSGKFTALQNDVLAVSSELERAFKGNNPTESGIHDWERSFSANSSPDQFLHGGQAVAKLLMGRLENLGDQYNRGMSRTSDPMVFLNPHAQTVLQAVTQGDLSKIPSTLPAGWDKAPITAAFLPGDSGAPPSPPGTDSGPPMLGGGGGAATVATMDPNSKLGVFKQTYRTDYDPQMAAGVNALIHKGASLDEANAYIVSHGGPAITDPANVAQYGAALTYAKAHPDANLVSATKSVPTTVMQRLASSPAAAALAGAAAGATAGLSDVAGRQLLGPAWDANRAALAGVHPDADMAGNVAGGVGGALVAPELVAKYAPGALSAGAKMAGVLDGAVPGLSTITGNAAYGGLYGASEDPNNPVGGGLAGAITGGIGGAVGRSATRGLANVIAPPAGDFAPLYQAGGFPTVGQRFARSGIAGRAINTAEQAMQSFPGLGAMVARARDIPRDAAQIGAFNDALGELKPFDAHVDSPISALPAGTQPGTAPHVFAQQAFNQAYPIARSGMQLVPGDDFKAANNAFADKWGPLLSGEQKGQLNALTNSAVDSRKAANNAFADKWGPLLSGEQKGQLNALINSAVDSRLQAGGGTLNGQAYQMAASDIGQAAQLWGKSDPLLGQAASEYGGILDAAARASSDPQAAALLDAADRGYAKYAGVIRPASSRVGGDPGEFTMKAFDRAVQNNASGPNGSQYLRGTALMQPFADAIRPLGDVLSNSGTGERLLTNRMFLGEQGAAGAGAAATPLGAAVMAHPGALAPFALYAPGANNLITRAIAPRQFTLPPAIAEPLNLAGSKINGLAPLVGNGAVPLALSIYGGPQ